MIILARKFDLYWTVPTILNFFCIVYRHW